MKPRHLPGGDLEYAVLAGLWDLGPATARAIHARIGEPRGLVYTTTAKVLDRLRDKGLVLRSKSGKAFVYEANVARERVEEARARHALGHWLGAAPRPAMAALLDALEALDPDLLDELETLVRTRRRKDRGS
jgi:predicted transcriptional regulator